MIGRTISNYRIIDRLGHGALGEAYVAVDLRLKRKLGFEVIPTDRLDRGSVARLRRDIEALAALEHPNIATPYSVESAEIGGDEPRTFLFFTHELIEGVSLDLMIPAGGLPAGRFLEMALPLTDALAAAHGKGVVHLGLRPETIVVSNGGQLKILDFGVVELKHELDEEESLQADSLPYRAPEQLDGRTVDPRADVFALGTVLYELAVGSRAFPVDGGHSGSSPALREPPPPITPIRPDLPASLEEIVQCCLQSDPEKRFIDAGGARAGLAKVQSEVESQRVETETAAATAAEETQRQKARSRRGLIAAIAAASLLVIAAAAWLVTRASSPAETEAKSPATSPVAAIATREMLAVLPFENLGVPEDQFFAEGMSAEIGRRVASVGSVGVIAHRAALRYDRAEKSADQIGRDFGAAHVLAGRATRETGPDGRTIVRLEPELFRASDGVSLWRQEYVGPAESLTALQASIATQVIFRLGQPLSDPPPPALRGQPTRDPKAHEEYLRAMAEWSRDVEGAEALLLAIGHLERAIELDPEFALAFARLAEVHSLLIERSREPSEHLLRADIAAFRARELAPRHPRSRAAMAAYFARRSDLVRALEEATAAERDLPDDPVVARTVSRVLRAKGDFEEAAERLRNALAASPLDRELTLELADTLRWLRRYEEADGLLRGAIDIDPESETAHRLLAENLLAWTGDTAAARAALGKIERPIDPATHLARVEAAVLAGEHSAALRHLSAARTWFSIDESDYTPKALWEAWIHELAGRVDRARAANRKARFELEELVEKDTRNARVRSSLGWAYAGRGLKDAAIREGRLGAGLITISHDAILGPRQVLDLAKIYALVGDAEAAAGELSLLLTIPGEISVELLRIDPVWNRARESPAFQELLQAPPFESATD